MLAFFNNVLDTLIRGLDKPVRITITIVIFCLAVLSFRKCLRPKNESSPISLGYLFLSIFLLFIAGLYMFV